MSLTRLYLRDFRNFQEVDLIFPPEGVALVGSNAQGKTNLLEAIHYLEMLRSFRGSQDSQLIRFGASFFRLEGHLASEMTMSVAFQRGGEGKRVRVNGSPPPRLGDALGHVGSVVFTPDDVRLISGGPQERRRFLDITLSLNVPGYLATLQRYRQVLTRRNAALRAQQPREGVRAWNPLLAEAGGAILRHRDHWIRTMAPVFAEIVEQVSAHESGIMTYRPGVTGLRGSPDKALPDPEAALLDALTAGESRERQRGVTLTGPHRDDLHLAMVRPLTQGEERAPDGEGEASRMARDLRDYGSGGQRRTAALALRVVEARTVETFRQRKPLLLLDDVFAELDEARSARILELFERMALGQVILTAPRDAEVRLRRGEMALWRIRHGTIQTGGDE